MAYSAIITWKPSKDRVAHLQKIWIKPLCPLVFETGEKQLRNVQPNLSQAHKVAITTHTYQQESVETQLSTAKEQQQREARSCLLKIVQSICFLARQGLALRGHDSDEGNLRQLLQLRSGDDDVLKRWLSKPSNNYTSAVIQNEVLNIMANSIYSIIIDGTQDVLGVEQEAICIRYVDHDLIPHEDFVGLYEVSSTTGKNLAKVATDVLLRLNLPLSCLRGQTYDGAANMSVVGQYEKVLLTALHRKCSSVHTPLSTEEHYRIEFFKVLDAVDVQLTKRFDQSSFDTLNKLERVLVSGKVEEVVSLYPELNRNSLEVQLAMFKLQYPSSTITDAVNTLKAMLPEVCALFTQVESLVRLLLVVPCSSAEAEQSFSALRRLKTWLRSSMSQRCLNNVGVCHIHQDKLDQVDIEEIASSLSLQMIQEGMFLGPSFSQSSLSQS
ncbi:hypothetical protein F7725_018902 [Dissostichus mawsoni]|uniref:HAT C-terminal dimerisation domain-containing protein n=1 Tax=Dissostichus mawsoni TaxID=36200 RepID=A0A7J5XST9_DISMA|nr:hypothetical protein F7725_018902 [Dissostichus mawsoni]